MTAAPGNGPRGPWTVLGVALGVAVTALSLSWWPASTGSADTSTTTSVPTTTTTSTVASTTTTVPGLILPWPQQGSSAVAIPQVSVAAASPHQSARPIASLTKMMTTWVILHRLPLAVGQRGPCVTVNAHDVAVYNHDVATGQSNAKVKEGERLCENALLSGLLVHSAGNFAFIFLRLMKMGETQFVAQMNRDAVSLGLRHTHYVDPTGIQPGDRSTALDQASLAADLMDSEPIVRQIVIQPHVVLPVAGILISYTPFVGEDGVIGVKSGYTVPAGGCDAMAVRFSFQGVTVTTFAVVLGQQGGDSINHAGEYALTLIRALRQYLAVQSTPLGKRVVWTGPPGDVVTTTTTTTTTTTVPVPTSSTTTTGP
jgi:serine-type D-Ala-D-Ala carboxypeptidase (penicillin-binding protein 5/6)